MLSKSWLAFSPMRCDVEEIMTVFQLFCYAGTSWYHEWNRLNKHHFDIKFLSFDLEIQVALFWGRLQPMHDKLPRLTRQRNCWRLSEHHPNSILTIWQFMTICKKKTGSFPFLTRKRPDLPRENSSVSSSIISSASSSARACGTMWCLRCWFGDASAAYSLSSSHGTQSTNHQKYPKITWDD